MVTASLQLTCEIPQMCQNISLHDLPSERSRRMYPERLQSGFGLWRATTTPWKLICIFACWQYDNSDCSVKSRPQLMHWLSSESLISFSRNSSNLFIYNRPSSLIVPPTFCGSYLLIRYSTLRLTMAPLPTAASFGQMQRPLHRRVQPAPCHGSPRRHSRILGGPAPAGAMRQQSRLSPANPAQQ
eukprot:COSAG01_NODE_25318_length_749_cov_0.849231_1_plen_185_part_00